MRVSHFATLQVIVPPSDYTEDSVGSQARLKTVGMAQNLRIDDNFGTRAENVIGTPLPVMAPGYQITNISIDKATIDGADFRNLGAFNPLWAHVGSTYQDSSLVSLGTATGAMDEPGLSESGGNEGMYPFMFVLAVKNRVANSYTKSNINTQNQPVDVSGGIARSNSFGIYACVLQSASISMSSQQAIIMDSAQVVARPLTGTWFTDAIRNAFANNGDATNGMRDIVNSVLFGYRY